MTRTDSMQKLDKLEYEARKQLSSSCARVMACRDPVKVEITNMAEGERVCKQVRDFAPGDDRASTREVVLTKTFFMERSDFRADGAGDADFWGLAPGKEVLLKYFFNFKCTSFEQQADGRVAKITGTLDKTNANKCKGAVHWVSCDSCVSTEVRMYEPLFTVENLAAPENKDKPWESFLNPNSEV